MLNLTKKKLPGGPELMVLEPFESERGGIVIRQIPLLSVTETVFAVISIIAILTALILWILLW